MQQDDTYITIKEAMGILGVTKSKLLRIIKDQELPTYENVLDKRQTLLERSQIMAMKMSPIQRKKTKEIIQGIMRATEFPGPDHVPVPKPPLGKVVILPTKEETE